MKKNINHAEEQELIEMCKHKWVEPIVFTGRVNIFTGEVEKLWQCEKCGVIKHSQSDIKQLNEEERAR